MANVTFALTEAVLEDLRAEFGPQIGPPPPFVSVITPAEAEAAAMVICAFPPPSAPGENVLTWCHDCGRAIVHRIHAPRAPIKVCLLCFGRRARAEA